MLLTGVSLTAIPQRFTRIPVDEMFSSARKIVFRDIVVTSKGDMVITASMGFASIVDHQLEISFPTGGLEDQDGNPGSTGRSPSIFKDAYELYTGFKSIAAGPEDIIYTVSDNNNFGLMDFKIGRGFIVPPFNFPNSSDIGKMWIDTDGDLFFAVKDSFFVVKDAIKIFEPGKKKLLYQSDFDKDSNIVITRGVKLVRGFSLGKNIIPTCFMDDSEGTIYIGTNYGIYQFDKKTSLFYNLFAKVNNKHLTITSIAAPEMFSEVWFSTLEKGLGSYNIFSKTVVCHPYRKNLSNPVSNLVRLSEKELLVAVTDSLPAIFNTEDSRYEFIQDTAFGKAKHSTTDIKVGSGKMVAVVMNGELYTSKDFLINHKVSREYPSGPYIKEILVNGASYAELVNDAGAYHSLKAIKLKYYQNNIDIIYAPRGVSSSDTIIFAWKMEGKWDQWTEVPFSFMEDKINIAGSNNLKPGTYLFRAKIKKYRGHWLKDEVALTILIAPPVWQTWWFWATVIAITSIFIFLVVKWRVSVARRQEREKLNHEKELLELEARALRAQMNPHFIFNCMNSIKALIQNDQKQKSIDYLTTFSKLIRTLFNNSDKRQISLYDELETCRLYTQLESMRLEGKLDYHFEIGEALDLKSVMVPALIIQPFIENAIWHGIVPKDKGTVTIRVRGGDEIIICEVDDDGIGRDLSKQNKPVTDVVHDSKGINLSQARLHLERELSEKFASVRIVDKHENGFATGTTAIIEFNLQ